MQNSNRDTSGRGFRPLDKSAALSGAGQPTEPIPNRTAGPATPNHGGQVSPQPDGRKKGGLAPSGQPTIPNR